MSNLIGALVSAMMTLPVTDSLRLVQLQPSMADELFALVDSNRPHLRKWLGWVDRTRTVEDIRGFIDFTTDQAASGSLTMAIIWNEKMVGLVSHHSIDLERKSVPVGYWIGQVYQGRGLVRQAVEAFTTYSFDHLDVSEVQIKTAVCNRRSQAIPTSLGFAHAGVLPAAEVVNGETNDVNLYVMTLERWRSRSCDSQLRPHRP